MNLLRIILLFLTCIVTTGLAEESGDMTEAGKEFLARLRKAAEAPPAAKPNPVLSEGELRSRVMPQVLTIGTENARGSGFLADLWGIPVIITNAHVFAKMESPELIDTMQNVYHPRAALVSKNRDLAIIAVDLPEDARPLPLNWSVAEVPLQDKLFAYGNAQGGDVITEKPGRLLGIGGKQLQISCEIVPGNSGGPVVSTRGEVVGMSTSLSVEADIASRLRELENPSKPKDRKPPAMLVRRFALRLDNISPDEFEIFDLELQRKDLEEFRRISMANDLFIKDFTVQPTFDGAQRLFFREFSQPNFDWQRKTSLKYLEPMLSEARQRSCLIGALFLMPIIKVREGDAAKVDVIHQQLVRARQERFVCRACNGEGSIVDHQFNQQSETVNCPSCAGLGRKEVPYFQFQGGAPLSGGKIPYLKFHQKLPSFGVDTEVAMRMIRPVTPHRRDLINGIFEFWSFPGNPAYSRVLETRMGFVGNRLSAIGLKFSRSFDSWRRLEQEYSKLYGAPVIKAGDYKSWGYVLWQRPGFTVALLTDDIGRNAAIHLVFRHNLLTQTEFRLRDELAGQYLVIPLNARNRDTRSGTSAQQEKLNTYRRSSSDSYSLERAYDKPHSDTQNIFF